MGDIKSIWIQVSTKNLYYVKSKTNIMGIPKNIETCFMVGLYDNDYKYLIDKNKLNEKLRYLVKNKIKYDTVSFDKGIFINNDKYPIHSDLFDELYKLHD
jgi:hypothetical protein